MKHDDGQTKMLKRRRRSVRMAHLRDGNERSARIQRRIGASERIVERGETQIGPGDRLPVRENDDGGEEGRVPDVEPWWHLLLPSEMKFE